MEVFSFDMSCLVKSTLGFINALLWCSIWTFLILFYYVMIFSGIEGGGFRGTQSVVTTRLIKCVHVDVD